MKKILEMISKLIIENIAFFIIMGLISLLGDKNSDLYQFKYVLQRYILPIVLSYNSGKLIEKKYGGIVAVLAINGLMVSYTFFSFLEPIVIGLLSGYLMKKYFEAIEKLRLPGYEMIMNNIGVVFIGSLLGAAFYTSIPFYKEIQVVLFEKVIKNIFNGMFVPLFAVFIEPAKVFFLNNLINHSVLSVVGFSELKEHGKSIFFLLETNPGPGLGVLLASYLYDKKYNKAQRTKEISSSVFIHFIGGIHEVYFPYVLRNMKLLVALIFGSITGIFLFQKFHVGLTSIASPGSAIIIVLLAPLSDKLFVILGILSSTFVTLGLSYLILISSKVKEDEDKMNSIEITNIDNLEICVACDAGMGSSAMGATLLKRKLEKEHIKGIKVVNSSIDAIPEKANMIIVHKQLFDRLDVSDDKDVLVVDDFMDGVFYDALVSKINEKLKMKKLVEEKVKVEVEVERPRLFVKENVLLGLKRTSKNEALRRAGEFLVSRGYVTEEYIESMIERENMASTYLDYGISIPHCTVDGVKYIKNSGIVILQYPYGIDYGNGKKVYLIIAIASIRDKHMRIISRLSDLIDDSKIAEQLATTPDIDEIYGCFSSLEDEDVK